MTGDKVEKRIANAKDDATYLLADVKIVATYPLFGIDRNKLEKLIHRFFESSRLDIEIKDRFGKPVKPREWFLVPLYVIDELVDRIKDGSIEHYKYDVEAATLVRHKICYRENNLDLMIASLRASRPSGLNLYNFKLFGWVFIKSRFTNIQMLAGLQLEA